MNRTVCPGCKEKFFFDETDIQTRDLGAYHGEPHIEGKEKYFVCPFCKKEIPLKK